MTQITIKRVYEDHCPADGYRVLIDRLWPRGMRQENLKDAAWEKGLAPSTELRKWFHWDPEDNWEGFEILYRKELETSEAVQRFVEQIKAYDKVTLLYASKDPVYNHARILKQFLQERLAGPET